MGFTVMTRAGERAVSAASAAGVLAELAAGKCAAAEKVVLRERLAHEMRARWRATHTLALY